MRLLCRQNSHILLLLHKEVVKLVCLCDEYSEICYSYCKGVISIVVKIALAEGNDLSCYSVLYWKSNS